MGSFFYGWRRKLGLVTLLTACVSIAGWVRSSSYVDFVWYPSSTSGYSVESLHGVIRLVKGTPVAPNMPIQYGSENLESAPHVKMDEHGKRMPFNPWNLLDGISRSDWFGISIGTATIKGTNTRIEMCVIPYWCVTVPLTLLSAWLLLFGRPKQTKPAV